MQGLNRMLQGGIRPGEFWIWPASLQHKYKTGFLNQRLIKSLGITNLCRWLLIKASIGRNTLKIPWKKDSNYLQTNDVYRNGSNC